MSHYVYAPKADANHSEVMQWYEDLYCTVIDIHKTGENCPDLIVGIAQSVNELVEVKTEDGSLTSGQKTFNRDWRGRKVVVVRTQADVINHVTRIRAKQAGASHG